MKHWRTLLTLLFLLPMQAWSQDLEYELELGGGLGTCFYTGDANSVPFKHSSAMGGIIARRVLNPRMVVKGDLAFGHVSGTSKGYYIPTDASSQTPEGGIPTTVAFKRNLIDLGAQFEFNFWGYGLGGGYKGHSPLTPYATMGIGFTLAFGGAGANLALNSPIGFGVKYKLKPRVNVGAEWTMRFTTTDNLDVSSEEAKQLNHPYGIASSGFKNKDCYSFLMLFVTYDLCPKYRKCNN